jgi:GNAT superfamily N-acetyltransferase
MSLPEGYMLSNDRGALQIDAIHAYLTQSYWSSGIPIAIVERAIAGSLCVGVFHSGAQIAFARLVTDMATFGWLADVYVLDGHRGRGIASAMVAHLQADPRLADLRRWMLRTRDAHPVYEALGWRVAAAPEGLMERVRANPYGAAVL